MEEAGLADSSRQAAHSAFDAALEWIALGLEAAGVGVILLGAGFAALAALPHWRTPSSRALAYRDFRHKLGHAILLGLELLVAADIVGTVAVEPSFENLGILAVIVLVRTFLSISLTVEIENRWPWQAEGGGQAERGGQAQEGRRGPKASGREEGA